MNRWMRHGRATARPVPGLWLALILIPFVAGCYTTLRHPQPDEAPSAHETSSCYQCHQCSHSLPPSSEWMDYYTSSDYPWVNYYGSPWWSEGRWMSYGDYGDATLAPRDAYADRRERVLQRWKWSHGEAGYIAGPDSVRQEVWDGWRARPVSPDFPTLSPPPSVGPAAGGHSLQGGDSRTAGEKPEKDTQDPSRTRVRARLPSPDAAGKQEAENPEDETEKPLEDAENPKEEVAEKPQGGSTQEPEKGK